MRASRQAEETILRRGGFLGKLSIGMQVVFGLTRCPEIHLCQHGDQGRAAKSYSAVTVRRRRVPADMLMTG